MPKKRNRLTSLDVYQDEGSGVGASFVEPRLFLFLLSNPRRNHYPTGESAHRNKRRKTNLKDKDCFMSKTLQRKRSCKERTCVFILNSKKTKKKKKIVPLG